MAKYPDMILDVANSQQLTGTYEVDTFHLKATHVAVGTVVINARKIIIDAGVQLNGIGTGYSYNQGPGTGGAHTQSSTGGYAGHYGGSGTGTSANNKKRDYGTKDGKDIDMGSGGGTIPGVSTAGRGGASITLNAEEITIAGVISVNGNTGTSHNTYYGSGGGSGGGVLVQAKHLTFTGSINARGGAGGNYSSRSGFNGSGGRIKVFYETGTITGAMDVMHGLASGSTVQRFSGTTHTAVEAYTPVLDFATSINVDVQVEDTATAMIEGNNVEARVPTKVSIDIPVAEASTDANLAHPFVGQEIYVDVATSTTDAINGAVRAEINAPSLIIETANTTIPSGDYGLVHIKANSYFTGKTVINAHTFIVDAGVTLSGNYNGYAGGMNRGAGQGPGGGRGGDDRAAGGQYGNGSSSYGTADGFDIDMGSGGGSNSYGFKGGNGGGALSVNASIVDIKGDITALGDIGRSQLNYYGAGGGAGGGVLVIGDDVTLTGSINVNGGRGGQDGYALGPKDGYGGTGGRIKVFYGSSFVNTGSLLANGGSGYYTAFEGTVHTASHEYQPIIPLPSREMDVTIALETSTAEASAWMPTVNIVSPHVIVPLETSTALVDALIPSTETSTDTSIKSVVAEMNVDAITPKIDSLVGTFITLSTAIATMNAHTPSISTVINAPTYPDLIIDTPNTVLKGTYTHGTIHIKATTYFEGIVKLNAHTIIVDKGVTLIGDERGFKGGDILENGEGDGGGRYYYNGTYDVAYGTGGSYGGIGGQSEYGGGVPYAYGTADGFDINMGSGGGGGRLTKGGSGGAAISLNASDITIDGHIQTNGGLGDGFSNGSRKDYGSGSGAGGGILIVGDKVAITGNLTANGGDGRYGGGSGAGGRIKVFHKNAYTNTGIMSSKAGTVISTYVYPSAGNGTTYNSYHSYIPVVYKPADGSMVISINMCAEARAEAIKEHEVFTQKYPHMEVDVATATKLALVPRVEVHQQVASIIATIEIEGVIPTVLTDWNAVSQVECANANISTRTPQVIVDVEIQGETAKLDTSALVVTVEHDLNAIIAPQASTAVTNALSVDVYTQRFANIAPTTAMSTTNVHAPSVSVDVAVSSTTAVGHAQGNVLKGVYLERPVVHVFDASKDAVMLNGEGVPVSNPNSNAPLDTEKVDYYIFQLPINDIDLSDAKMTDLHLRLAILGLTPKYSIASLKITNYDFSVPPTITQLSSLVGTEVFTEADAQDNEPISNAIAVRFTANSTLRTMIQTAKNAKRDYINLIIYATGGNVGVYTIRKNSPTELRPSLAFTKHIGIIEDSTIVSTSVEASTAQAETHDVVVDVVAQLQPVVEIPSASAEMDALSCSLSTGVTIQSSYAFASARGLSPSGANSINTQVDADVASAYADLVLAQVVATRYETVSAELSTATIDVYPSTVAIDTEIIVDEPVDATITQTYQPRITIDMAVQVEPSTAQTSASNADVDLQQAVYMETATASMEGLEVRLYLTRIEKETVSASLDTVVNQSAPNNSYYNSTKLALNSSYQYTSTPTSYVFMRFPVRKGATLIDSVLTVHNVEFKGNRGPTLIVSTLRNPFPSTGLTWNKMTSGTRQSVATRSVKLELWGIEDMEVSIPIGLSSDKSFIYAHDAVDVMIHRTVTESGTQALASMESYTAYYRPRMTHTYRVVETVGYTEVAVDAVSASATGSISAPRVSVGYSVDVPIAEASTTETRAEVRPGIGARIDADVAVATLNTNTPVFYLHDSDIMKVSNTGYAYATTFVPRPVVVRNALLDVAPATAHADKLDMRVGISPNVRPTISSGIASANNPSTQTGMTVRMTTASSRSQASTPQIKTTRTSAIRTITSTASVEALSTTFYIGLTPIIDVDVASVTEQAMSPQLYIGLSPSTSATPAQATIETPAPSLYIGNTTHIHAVSATAQARGIVPTPFIQKENVLAQEKSAELSMVAIAPVVKTTEFISTSVDTATGMIEGVNPTIQTTIAIKAPVATATTEMNKPTPFVKFDVDVAVDSVATMDERVSPSRISVGVSLPTNTAQATTDANSPSTSSHVAINTIRGYAYAQAPAPTVQLGKSASTTATFGYAYEQASTPKVRVDAVISTPHMDAMIESHNPRIDIAYEVQLKTAQAFAYPLTPRIVRDVTVATDNGEILITTLPAQATGAANVKVISSATSEVDTSEVQVYADQHVEVKASVMVEEVSALAGKVQVSSFIRTDLSARATARGNNPAIDIRYNMTIPVAQATTEAIAPNVSASTSCSIQSDTPSLHMQAVAPSTRIERATTIQTTQVATSAVYAMLAQVNARQATYVYPVPVEAYAQAMNAQATTNTTIQAPSTDTHVTALSPKFELDKEQRAMVATGTATALTASVQASASINAPTSDSHIDALVPSTFRETPVQMTTATATAHAQVKGTSAEYKGFQRTPAFYDGAISGTAQHETYEHDSSITMNARTRMTLRFDIRHLTKDSDIRQFAIDLKTDKLRTYSFAFMYVYTTTKPFDTAPTYYRSNGIIGEQIARMSVYDNASNVTIGATATQNPKLLQYLRQCVSEGREYLDLFIGWSHSLGYERDFYLSESGLAPTLRIDHDTVLTTGFENARGIILEAPALQVEMLDVAVQTNLVATIEVDNAVASIDALPVRAFELDNLIATNVALTTADAVAPMVHATQADTTSIPVATAHSSIIEMDVYTRAHAFIDAETSSTHIEMLDVDAHATKVVKITAHLIDAEIEMAAPSIAVDATVKTLNVAHETMDAPVATVHVDYTASPRYIYMTDEALTPSVQASCNVAIKAIPVIVRGMAQPPKVIGGRDAIFTIDNAWSTATTGITSVTVKAQQHITTTLATSTARITTARPKVEANIGAIIYVDEATAHIEAPNGVEINTFQAIIYMDNASTAIADAFAPSVETVSFMDVQSDVATMDTMMDAPRIISGHGVAVTMDCAETSIDAHQPSTQIDMPINVPSSTGLAATSTPVAYVLYPNVDVNVAVAESIAEGNVPRIFVEQINEVFVESAEMIVDALVPSVQIREDVLFPIRVSVDHIDDKHNDNHLVLLERKEDRHIIFHVLEADGQPFAFEKHTAQFVVRDAKNKVVYTAPLVIDGDGLISLHWVAKDINKKGNYRGTINLHDLSTAKTYRIPTDDYLIVTVLDTKKEKQRDDLLEDLFEEGQQQQIIEDALTATEQTDEYNKRKEYDVDEIAKYFE